MKRFGKITVKALIIILICAGLYMGHGWIEKAKAGESASFTLTIPVLPSYGVTTVDNVYWIVYDIDTGYLADGAGASAGVTAVDTTWDNAVIESAHAGTNVWVSAGTIPALDNSKRWAIAGFENATPANTDTPKYVFLLDPENKVIGGEFYRYTKNGSLKVANNP